MKVLWLFILLLLLYVYSAQNSQYANGTCLYNIKILDHMEDSATQR
jgi:hypothetical protein